MSKREGADRRYAKTMSDRKGGINTNAKNKGKGRATRKAKKGVKQKWEHKQMKCNCIHKI